MSHTTKRGRNVQHVVASQQEEEHIDVDASQTAASNEANKKRRKDRTTQQQQQQQQQQAVVVDSEEAADSAESRIIFDNKKGSRIRFFPNVVDQAVVEQTKAIPIVDELPPAAASSPPSATTADAASAKLYHDPPIVIMGRVCKQNRDVGFFSDASIGYRYSTQIMPSQPLQPWMRDVMARVNERLGTQFNGILINKYSDGSKTIGAHADDEKALDKQTRCVAAVSIGADRKFRVRDRKTKAIVKDVPTVHRGMLTMEGKFQDDYTHEVPMEKKVTTPRWSLTFRHHLK